MPSRRSPASPPAAPWPTRSPRRRRCRSGQPQRTALVVARAVLVVGRVDRGAPVEQCDAGRSDRGRSRAVSRLRVRTRFPPPGRSRSSSSARLWSIERSCSARPGARHLAGSAGDDGVAELRVADAESPSTDAHRRTRRRRRRTLPAIVVLTRIDEPGEVGDPSARGRGRVAAHGRVDERRRTNRDSVRRPPPGRSPRLEAIVLDDDDERPLVGDAAADGGTRCPRPRCRRSTRIASWRDEDAAAERRRGVAAGDPARRDSVRLAVDDGQATRWGPVASIVVLRASSADDPRDRGAAPARPSAHFVRGACLQEDHASRSESRSASRSVQSSGSHAPSSPSSVGGDHRRSRRRSTAPMSQASTARAVVRLRWSSAGQWARGGGVERFAVRSRGRTCRSARRDRAAARAARPRRPARSPAPSSSQDASSARLWLLLDDARMKPAHCRAGVLGERACSTISMPPAGRPCPGTGRRRRPRRCARSSRARA